MSHISVFCSNSLVAPPASIHHYQPILHQPTTLNRSLQRRQSTITVSAAKSGGFSFNSIFKGCEGCEGKGGIQCPGCKGTGKNKKDGNIFERWKCYRCQGFGLVSCPTCGKGGLTPEQRGER